MLRAAPLSAMMRPNMAPKQMMAVSPPSISPTPRSSDLPMSLNGMPKHRAADRAIAMKAAKGGTLPHPMRRISNAIRRITATTVKARAAPLKSPNHPVIMALCPTGSKLHPQTHTVHPPENIV